jgi:hypothetical protein
MPHLTATQGESLTANKKIDRGAYRVKLGFGIGAINGAPAGRYQEPIRLFRRK